CLSITIVVSRETQSWALVFDRRQHDAVEDGEGDGALQRVAVVTGIDHDHEIERRHDIEALAAQADTGRPAEFAAVAEGAAEPPLITIEEQALAVDARLDRL